MTSPGPGRPRDEQGRRAVLAAARDLVVTGGYESVTMAEIALRAGVGRQTLYRWWPSKQAIIAACVLDDVLSVPLDVAAATGDARADLRGWMLRAAASVTEGDSAALFRALLAAAASDADTARRMTEAFADPLRAGIRAALTGAAHPADPDLVADVMIGALLNAIVTREPAAAARLLGIADAVLAG